MGSRSNTSLWLNWSLPGLRNSTGWISIHQLDQTKLPGTTTLTGVLSCTQIQALPRAVQTKSCGTYFTFIIIYIYINSLQDDTKDTAAKHFLLDHAILSQHLLAYWIFRWFEAVCTECALGEKLRSISKSCPTNKCHRYLGYSQMSMVTLLWLPYIAIIYIYIILELPYPKKKMVLQNIPLFRVKTRFSFGCIVGSFWRWVVDGFLRDIYQFLDIYGILTGLQNKVFLQKQVFGANTGFFLGFGRKNRAFVPQPIFFQGMEAIGWFVYVSM